MTDFKQIVGQNLGVSQEIEQKPIPRIKKLIQDRKVWVEGADLHEVIDKLHLSADIKGVDDDMEAVIEGGHFLALRAGHGGRLLAIVIDEDWAHELERHLDTL